MMANMTQESAHSGPEVDLQHRGKKLENVTVPQALFGIFLTLSFTQLAWS